MQKPFYLTTGLTFTVLGGIGIVLPLVPTTPFLLLASFCFARSSDRLHRWLLSRPTVGTLISDWEEHRVIRRGAKISSSLLIAGMMSYPIFFSTLSTAVRVVLFTIAVAVIAFLWSCRSEKPVESRSTPKDQQKPEISA